MWKSPETPSTALASWVFSAEISCLKSDLLKIGDQALVIGRFSIFQIRTFVLKNYVMPRCFYKSMLNINAIV